MSQLAHDRQINFEVVASCIGRQFVADFAGPQFRVPAARRFSAHAEKNCSRGGRRRNRRDRHRASMGNRQRQNAYDSPNRYIGTIRYNPVSYDRRIRHNLTRKDAASSALIAVRTTGCSSYLFSLFNVWPVSAIGTTLRAQIFHDPFVARNGNRFRFLHQLRACVDFGRAREPIEPHELLWLGVRSFRVCAVLAFGAYVFTVRAAVLAGARHAEVFALTTPANDFHVLFFAHQSADFLARGRAPAMCAAALLGSRHLRSREQCQRRQDHTRELGSHRLTCVVHL